MVQGNPIAIKANEKNVKTKQSAKLIEDGDSDNEQKSEHAVLPASFAACLHIFFFSFFFVFFCAVCR